MCNHDPSNRRREGRNWRCRDCKNEWLREWWAKLRREVMDHYGAVCVCCGEDWYYFLQFDHVNGDGHIERGRTKYFSGNTQAKLIKRAGYPDTYQILCANCNIAKGLGRDCPSDHNQAVRDHGRIAA